MRRRLDVSAQAASCRGRAGAAARPGVGEKPRRAPRGATFAPNPLTRRPRPTSFPSFPSRRSPHVGWFTKGKQLDSLDDLLVDHLNDLYDAEQRLTKALPKMAAAAHSASLKAAFTDHLRETQN